MNGLEFVASLVRSLAWPTAVVVVVLVFRRQLGGLLSGGLTRVKAGPFQAEWERVEKQTTKALGESDLGPAPESGPISEAEVSPLSVIVTRHAELLHNLRRYVERQLGPKGIGLSDAELVDKARDAGLITPMTAQALTGVTVMRNLAAHGPAGYEVSPEKAAEFIVISDATEFALRHEIESREGA